MLQTLTLAAVFWAASLLCYSFAPDADQLYRRVRQGGRSPAAKRRRPHTARLVAILDAIAPYLRWFRGGQNADRLRRDLQRAGLGATLTTGRVLVLQIFAALGLMLLAIAVLPGLTLVAAPLAAVGGWLLPGKLIADRGATRARAIVRALPSAIDLLALLVAAGMDFLHAVARVAERLPSGPLREELHELIDDVHHRGRPRAEAIKALGARVQTPEMSSLTGVLAQACSLGAPIGPVLRQQSITLQLERCQRAEKMAGAASQRMVLPIVLCTLPAAMLVILGPLAIQYLT